MRISKLKLYNISSYAGVCEFDFGLENDKNIILIGGQNGAGKTSLFSAIKLALYGPLCFNYQSNNTAYYTKIKELINHNAYMHLDVVAYVELEIILYEEREPISYTIKREWMYENQKITERLSVIRLNEFLEADGILFFQNYLHTILPPNLFEFFFFDGEMIADFFATSNYNNYVKNAMLTLCNFDTFELIKKFSDNYINTSDATNELVDVSREYEEVSNKLESLKEQISSVEKGIVKLNESLFNIQLSKKELEAKFHNAGGLTVEEKDSLNKQLKKHETVKNEASIKIRNFVEELMPFIITRQLAEKIGTQIVRENQATQYLVIQDKLNSSVITDIVGNLMDKFGIEKHVKTDEFISELFHSLNEKVKPSFDMDKFRFTHGLSQEQQNQVNLVLEMVSRFDPDQIIKLVNKKNISTDETTKINKKLRDAMPENDVSEFTKAFADMTNSEYTVQTQIDSASARVEQLKNELGENEKHKNELYERLKESTQNKNVYELTQKISSIMGSLIHDVTQDKLKQIEHNILFMLKKIMRKESFIDSVELDEKFNIFLYKNQVYTYKDILNLIKNIGYEEFGKRIGVQGVELIKEKFGISSLSQLRKSITLSSEQLGLFDDITIELYQKLELGQLSKGEKQIFILALYWAIIRVSNHDIPFVIDTPYARIDAKHREQISKEYFPSVSSQVIILSTDEEITETYYGVLKPYIAKEYLLVYDEVENKTTVRDNYFFRM